MFYVPGTKGARPGCFRTTLQHVTQRCRPRCWAAECSSLDLDELKDITYHVTGLPPSLLGGPHASVAAIWLAPRTDGM